MKFLLILVLSVSASFGQHSIIKIEPTASDSNVLNAIRLNHELQVKYLHEKQKSDIEIINLNQKNSESNTQVNHDNSVFLKERAHNYNVEANIISRLTYVNNVLDDRVRWEFHVVAGARSTFTTPEGFAGLGIKFNLNNPKILNTHNVMSSLNEISYFIDSYNHSNKEILKSKFQKYQDIMKKYNAEVFWKRVSIGVTIPLVDSASGLTYSSANRNNRYRYDYFFSKIYCNVGYDIADWVTFNGGVNMDGEFTAAFSIDISTPVTSSLYNFMNYLADEVGMDPPQKTNSNPSYNSSYYRYY